MQTPEPVSKSGYLSVILDMIMRAPITAGAAYLVLKYLSIV